MFPAASFIPLWLLVVGERSFSRDKLELHQVHPPHRLPSYTLLNCFVDDRLLPPSAASREPSALPAVRFASRNLEIEPSQSLQASMTLATDDSIPNSEISSEAREEIRSISRGLHNSQLQQRRMSNFAFEPVSLPVSRVSKCVLALNRSRSIGRPGLALSSMLPALSTLAYVDESDRPRNLGTDERVWSVPTLARYNKVGQNNSAPVSHTLSRWAIGS